MTRDDSRHGTNPGYIAGCRDQCCKTAHATYRRRLRDRQYLVGGGLEIDITGTRRRLHALVALGHTLEQISTDLGRCPSWASNLLRRQKEVHRATARDVTGLYERLSMTRGPSDQGRRFAARKGWLPPLAWDDDTIDDPAADPYRPALRVANPERHLVDDVLVQRALGGQKVKANQAERLEVIRRWQAAGRSLRSLNITQGWSAERDLREAS